MDLIQVFKMQTILLLILSFTKIKANGVNNLPEDLEKLWLGSQVLIYHNPDIMLNYWWRIQDPDCFGNFLSTHYIITASSCFINVNEILKNSETNEEERSKVEIISRSIKQHIKIEKTRIAKVSKKQISLFVKHQKE